MIRNASTPQGVTDEESSDERRLYGDSQHEAVGADGAAEQTLYGEPQHEAESTSDGGFVLLLDDEFPSRTFGPPDGGGERSRSGGAPEVSSA
ncbi:MULTISPECIES: hypothetical protein [Halorussus]|uniref:hypothetical protein n=1 Tax=Halorussus TaxID=1070314 RepID=UPI00209F3AB2|nr:hypothetical protein [Halorussus vallis]USZ77291.1 hypothetical protein NGM07_08155 [Halorussus vallis]